MLVVVIPVLNAYRCRVVLASRRPARGDPLQQRRREDVAGADGVRHGQHGALAIARLAAAPRLERLAKVGQRDPQVPRKPQRSRRMPTPAARGTTAAQLIAPRKRKGGLCAQLRRRRKGTSSLTCGGGEAEIERR